MKPTDELRAENEALRDRLSRLSESSLRISESLDVNTVLHEVVESARALTSAGCSGITTMDASGHLQDFVTAGVSPEEYQRFLHLPHGPRLWEYLRAIPQPLRLRDLAAHLGPLGFPADPTLARSFLGTPIRHRGVQVGNFYLADKEGGQAFTREDEEVLALFASQAGAAIAKTPAGTGPSSGRGPTWRPWSTPHRWASWSSMPGPAIQSRSTGRRSGSSAGCACRAAPRSSCSRSCPGGVPTGGRSPWPHLPSCAKTRPFETDHNISSLVSVFATGSRAVLRLPTQLLPVGKGFRQQPPRRCQESILPGNAFPPVVGDGVQAVEGAGELPRHCCYRISVVGQVGREQHRAAEVSGAGDLPDGGFERVNDVPAGADRIPCPSSPAAGYDLSDCRRSREPSRSQNVRER